MTYQYLQAGRKKYLAENPKQKCRTPFCSVRTTDCTHLINVNVIICILMFDVAVLEVTVE
jgi:hypothetical protein